MQASGSGEDALNEAVGSEKTPNRCDWIRRSIVILACALNIGSVACLAYQELYPLDAPKLVEGVRGLFEDVFYYPLANLSSWRFVAVNYGIWLAPTVAVLLLRKYWTVAACYALVLLPILLGRIYYALSSAWTGDSGHHQKGDWASWAMTLVGTASAAVIAIWVAVAAIWVILQLVSLASGRGVRPS